MRISDWSSDVCSSDLHLFFGGDIRIVFSQIPILFSCGYDSSGDKISGDVERRTAHVQETVNSQYQPNTLGRHAHHAQDERYNWQRSRRNAGCAEAPHYAYEHHHELNRKDDEKGTRV